MLQLQSQFLNFHYPTWPYAGLWNVLVTSISDNMLVPMHLPGSAVQDLFCYIPVYWGVLWFWKPAITRWHTTISIEIKFCKRKCQDVESRCVILVPQAVQKRMLFRNVMSKKWRHFVYHELFHQWPDESWCLPHSFVTSTPNCLDIYVEVVS